VSVSFFTRVFDESVRCKTAFIAQNAAGLSQIADVMCAQLKAGKKLLLFGNGGSAADAQHLAAEFVNRLMVTRQAIPAISLVTDTSVLTSIANDDSYNRIFARQIEALGQAGDIAWGFSTSGNSSNVIEGFNTAQKKKLVCIATLGNDGGTAKSLADYSLIVQSKSTQRIQEVHITIGHALCEWIENKLSDTRD
jgi:D-sedoheptulose 7-phosphate isomerase